MGHSYSLMQLEVTFSLLPFDNFQYELLSITQVMLMKIFYKISKFTYLVKMIVTYNSLYIKYFSKFGVLFKMEVSGGSVAVVVFLPRSHDV